MDFNPQTKESGRSWKVFLVIPALFFAFIGSLAFIGAFSQLTIFNMGHVVNPSQPPAVSLLMTGLINNGTDCSSIGQGGYLNQASFSLDWGNVTVGSSYDQFICLENIGNQPWQAVTQISALPAGIVLSTPGLIPLPPAHSELVDLHLFIDNLTAEQDFSNSIMFSQ